MKILVFTNKFEDYIPDAFVYGARKLGHEVIDYPKKEVLYKNCTKKSSQLYGNGFTMWRLLDDIDLDRRNILERLEEFDLIVLGSIYRMQTIHNCIHGEHKVDDWWGKIKPKLNEIKGKLAFFDGEDEGFPVIHEVLSYGAYFKRENVDRITHIHNITMSIPEEKIRKQPIKKDRMFATHVQCEEAYRIDLVSNNCQKSYAFDSEQDYYDDIARSYFGINKKKSSWGSMRIYETAANWSVPAYYKLSEKPVETGPTGLVDMKNSVWFNTAEELAKKTQYLLNNNEYEETQKQAREWVKQKTCKKFAKQIIGRV